MMKAATLLSTIALAAMAAFGGAQPAQAAHESEIRREAAHLMAKAGELKGLFHAHYRHAHNYRQLDEAAHDFHDLTRHMRQHAFAATCDLPGLRQDMVRAERLFGRLEHLAYEAERSAVRGHRHNQGASQRLRQVLHETSYCLSEFRDLVRPAVVVHPRHSHRDAHRLPVSRYPHGDHLHAPRDRRDFDRGRSTIQLGNSNLGIRFSW